MYDDQLDNPDNSWFDIARIRWAIRAGHALGYDNYQCGRMRRISRRPTGPVGWRRFHGPEADRLATHDVGPQEATHV